MAGYVPLELSGRIAGQHLACVVRPSGPAKWSGQVVHARKFTGVRIRLPGRGAGP